MNTETNSVHKNSHREIKRKAAKYETPEIIFVLNIVQTV